MKKLLALILLPVMLFGCSAAVQQQIVDDQTKINTDLNNALLAISKVAVPDLQAAAADATAHNDPEAAMCWNGLIPIAQSLGSGGANPTIPQIKGGASLFQAVRDLIRGGAGASAGTPIILKQINMACGPLYVSARGDVIKILVMVGAISAGGPGAAGAAGAIPAAIQPLVNQLIGGGALPLPIPIK